jgi:hypothetical protein
MMFKRLQAFVANCRGATVIEFAIVCPVFMLLIMGLAELAFQGYLQAALTGEVQKAARDSTIDGNATTDAAALLDKRVRAQIARIIGATTWDTPVRQNYAHFADISPEYFFDSNNNGKYDSGECFIDSNANGVWDADPSQDGQGGANAVVVYQMGFTYTRLFPIVKLLGWPATAHITAKTILKNQPYKYANTADNLKVCK